MGEKKADDEFVRVDETERTSDNVQIKAPAPPAFEFLFLPLIRFLFRLLSRQTFAKGSTGKEKK